MCVDLRLELKAPADRVWNAISTTDGLKTWYSDTAMIEERVGGRLFFADPQATPKEENLVSKVVCLDPGRLMVLKALHLPSRTPNRRAAKGVYSVIYLTPLSESSTLLEVRCLCTQSTSKVGPLADSMRESAEQALKRLKKAVEVS